MRRHPEIGELVRRDFYREKRTSPRTFGNARCHQAILERERGGFIEKKRGCGTPKVFGDTTHFRATGGALRTLTGEPSSHARARTSTRHSPSPQIPIIRRIHSKPLHPPLHLHARFAHRARNLCYIAVLSAEQLQQA